MNRTARRTAAAGVALAALMGGLVAVAPSAAAATPCDADCITGLTATPYADGVRLDVATNTPTLVSAEVWFGATLVKSFAPPAGADFTANRTWDMKTGLSQGAWYRYVVKAADSFGHVRTEEGTFRTGRRTLAVTFDKVYVQDDSDSLSAGDITSIGSAVGATSKGTNLGGAQWSSGGTYSVPSLVRNYTIEGAKNGASVKFVLEDDDDDAWDFGIWGGGCTTGQLCTPYFSSGSNAQADWATATSTLALDGRTGTRTGTFSLSTPSSAAIRYTVSGVWKETVRNIASAPTSLVATPYNGSVTLAWGLPADTGSAAILGFRVTSTTGGSWNLPANARSLSVTGLTNGTPVTFAVVAVNSEGDSPKAKATSTPAAVPNKISYVNASGGNGVVNVAWPAATGEGTTHYRVYVAGVLKADTTATNATIPAANGVPVTVSVTPYNALGNGPSTAMTGTVTPYAPSAISGWNPNAMSGKYGTSWTTTLTVTNGGQSGRPVELQRRLRGGTAWATYGTYATTIAGTVPVSIPFSTGIWEWRAVAPAWKTYAAASTGIKQMARTTTISGWSTTTSSYATGWTVLDGITVTPGNGRQVILIGKQNGTSTWSILGKWNCDTNGNVSVPIKVKAGTWQYSVIVEDRYDLGGAASTATRTITGT